MGQRRREAFFRAGGPVELVADDPGMGGYGHLGDPEPSLSQKYFVP